MLTLLLLTFSWWSEEAPGVTVISETNTSLIDEWGEDELMCKFWNSNTRYRGSLCSHFSLSRLVSTVADEALIRALNCGAKHETDCVLAPEVGVNLPAGFVYDDNEGFKMIVAPKITRSLDPHRVNIVHPVTLEETEFDFNRTITVEYLPATSRAPVSAEFVGIGSYCIQMIRLAFAESCWNSLD
tara:strand:- start:197 stop:751 length:555 start_codon:yes stop_codon:yes gene_type:complete